MPLAKMARGIALCPEGLIKGEFTLPEVTVVGRVNSRAIVMPTGHNRSACGRTYRSLGIEAGQIESVGRHFVEVRCADVGTSIESDVSPTQIIAHNQDHVGFLPRFRFGLDL